MRLFADTLSANKKIFADTYLQIKSYLQIGYLQIRIICRYPKWKFLSGNKKVIYQMKKIRLPPLEVHFGVRVCSRTDSVGGGWSRIR